MLGINEVRISRNFMLSEFASPDTQEVKIYPELVLRLQRLRDIFNVPIKIDSGYRTPSHNHEVNGEIHSFHLEGKAADISCLSIPLERLFHACVYIGFRGIIVYEDKKFIHVDIRPGSRVLAPHNWKTKALVKNMFRYLSKETREVKIRT